MSQALAVPVAAHDEYEVAQGRRILFVCTGNTCRSPMAAALLNDKMRPREICSAACEEQRACRRITADSAGLWPEVGTPITPLAAAALAEAGVVATPDNDYIAHRARAVSEALMNEADEVVAISGAHAMELMMRYPQHAAKITTLGIDIPDPYGGDAARYRACLQMLSYAITRRFCAEESHED